MSLQCDTHAPLTRQQIRSRLARLLCFYGQLRKQCCVMATWVSWRLEGLMRMRSHSEMQALVGLGCVLPYAEEFVGPKAALEQWGLAPV